VAIGLTLRSSINSNTDATSYATGSFTPSANVLLVAIYASPRFTADPTTPTVSGHGTWTLVDSLLWNNDTNDHGKLFIYALNTGASPGSSAVTFDHAGVTHHGAQASVFELSGTDVANGVAQCFVQFVHSSVNSDGGSSSLALTLASAGTTANRPFMTIASLGAFSHIPQTSWTTLAELNQAATPFQALYAEWRSDAFDTAAFVDYTQLVRRGGIAFEVKAKPFQTVTMTSLIDQSGVLFAPQANRRLASTVAFQLHTFQPDAFQVATGGAFQADTFQDDTFQFAHDTHLFVDQTYRIFEPTFNLSVSLAGEAGFQDDGFQDDTFQFGAGFLNYAGGTFAPLVNLELPGGAKTLYAPLIDQTGELFAPDIPVRVLTPLIDQSGVVYAPVGTPQFVSFGAQVSWDDAAVLWDDADVHWDFGGGTIPIDQSGVVYDPAVGTFVVPELIDQTGVLYAPQVQAQFVLPPLLDYLVLYEPQAVNQTGIPIPLIDQTGVLYEFSTNATTAPLIDQTGVLYAPQVNVQLVLVPFIDLSFEGGGAVYAPQANFEPAFVLIDQSGVLFEPYVDAIFPGFIDQSGVVYMPALGYLQPPLIDQTGVIFDPDHITIPATQSVRLDESLAQFIDQSGVVFDPEEVELAPPRLIDGVQFIDQSGEPFAPRVVQPTRPTIVLRARYDPVAVQHARYDPVTLKHAQNARQG
jgi:hypothetical protein